MDGPPRDVHVLTHSVPKRRASDLPTVTGGNGDGTGLAGLFLRLLDLTDRAVMDVIVIVIGKTLESGSADVEAVGTEIVVDMARIRSADDAFFECLRDKRSEEHTSELQSLMRITYAALSVNK